MPKTKEPARTQKPVYVYLLIGAITLAGAIVLSGLSGPGSDPEDPASRLQALLHTLPAYAKYHPEVEATYRLALENYEELQWIPCYCGCGTLGHRSNVDCYLSADPAQRGTKWVPHGST